MSFDSAWNSGPSYRPTFRTPTFVRERGLDQVAPIAFANDVGRGEQVRTIYEGLTARWNTDKGKAPEVIELEDDPDSEIELIKVVRPRPSTSKPIPPTSLPHATSSSNPTRSTPKPPQTSNSQWFIRHSLTSLESTHQFSLTASAPPPTSKPTSLASLINLPEPGSGPAFVPPPHFHLKPGNKGYDLLKSQGWAGRGLGKDANLAPPLKEPIGKNTATDDVVDISLSSESEEEDKDDSFPMSDHPPSQLPIPPLPAPHSSSSRQTLIAPLATTLKNDYLGIRSSASTAHHRAITHTHQAIRQARRDAAQAEGRLSAKEIGKRTDRERKERLALMARLNS